MGYVFLVRASSIQLREQIAIGLETRCATINRSPDLMRIWLRSWLKPNLEIWGHVEADRVVFGLRMVTISGFSPARRNSETWTSK